MGFVRRWEGVRFGFLRGLRGCRRFSGECFECLKRLQNGLCKACDSLYICKGVSQGLQGGNFKSSRSRVLSFGFKGLGFRGP